MKEATRAPAYAFIYHGLATVARKYGYALAMHGSILTDLDLIAVPWVDDAAEPDVLKEAIRKHCGRCQVNIDIDGNETDIPAKKPHGRLAWKFFMAASGSVDLSVLPKIDPGEYCSFKVAQEKITRRDEHIQKLTCALESIFEGACETLAFEGSNTSTEVSLSSISVDECKKIKALIGMKEE